ncbi:MAG: hypothetical protein RQ899_12480, partial [Pseudomonadales bacterium]|nr:hypothetical protein [Pseudomonadales bacterium]
RSLRTAGTPSGVGRGQVEQGVANRRDFYVALIDLFFAYGDNLRFRCIAVDRTQLNLALPHSVRKSGKADISTLQESGHFYLALTPESFPPVKKLHSLPKSK